MVTFILHLLNNKVNRAVVNCLAGLLWLIYRDVQRCPQCRQQTARTIGN